MIQHLHNVYQIVMVHMSNKVVVFNLVVEFMQNQLLDISVMILVNIIHKIH